MGESIETLFGRKGIWRNKELVAEGVQFRDLQRALDEGVVVRPVFARKFGPVPGLFISPALNYDSDKALIVACAVTGGVVGRHTAGFRYNMTTDLPRRVEVHVRDTYSRVPPQLLIETMRSRNEAMRTVGVEPVDTEHGVQFWVTTPARTVVDIIGSGRQDGRDYEHALDAVAAYLSAGGEPGEIRQVADALGLNWGDRIDLAIDAVERGMGARRAP